MALTRSTCGWRYLENEQHIDHVLRSRIKFICQLIDPGTERITKTCKFHMEKQTLTYRRLHQLVGATLKLRTDFVMLYRSGTYKHCSDLLSDWDLDAAIHGLNASKYLLLRVCPQLVAVDELAEWNIVAPFEIPIEGFEETMGEQMREGGKKERGDRTSGSLSVLDKLVDRLESIFTERSTPKNSPYKPLKPPMSFREFQNYLDPAGRLIHRQEFLESVYQGGVSSSYRKIIWRHILNIYPPGMTAKSRTQYLSEKAQSYNELKAAWKKQYEVNDDNLPQEITFIITQVRKDVIRTDRTHSFYKGKEDNSNITNLYDLLCTYAINHPEVSYCQGMCDIASPILMVQEDEAHAYLLFCAIMERLKYNFMSDGRAVSTKFEHLIQLVKYFDPQFYTYMQEHQVDDLLFAYRWLLLELKREFPLNESLYFMEVMWSTLPISTNCWIDIPLTSSETFHIHSNRERLIYTKLDYLETHGTDEFLDLTERTGTETESEPPSNPKSFSKRALNLESSNAEDKEIDLVMSAKKMCPCLNSEGQCNYIHGCLSVTPQPTASIDNLSTLSDKSYPNGSKSVDSGFLSRSVTPNRNSTELVDYLDDYFSETADISTVFPPPAVFGYGNPFLMFAVLAMILQHRNSIMDEHMDFNDIMLLFNQSVRKNDVCKILHDSRAFYQSYINFDINLKKPTEDSHGHSDAEVED